MRTVLIGIAWCAGLAVLAGALGALHPVGDSLAVLRVPVAGVALLCGFALRRMWRVALVGVMAAILAWHGWQSLRPQWQGDAPLTLYQKNLLSVGGAGVEWMVQLRQTGADIVTLQELGWNNSYLLDYLSDLYPHQLHCPLPPNLGEAVLSRYPFVEGTKVCSDRDGLAVVQVDAPDGPVWVVSVHLSWPWPHDQAHQIGLILPALERVSGPVVVAGDFNSVAWSHTVQRIGTAAGARRIGPHTATFRLPKVGLPIGIDHILSSGPGRITRLPLLGSDHHGLLAGIDPYVTGS